MTRSPNRIQVKYGTERGYVRYALSMLEHYAGTSHAFLKPDLKKVRRLVFVCLGNICRSAYGHHFADKNHHFEVASFGLSTTTGVPCNPIAAKVAERRGTDMSGHRTTDINDFEICSGDLLLAMELRQARRLLPMIGGKTNVQIALLGNWSTPLRPHIHDPHTLSEEYFDTCFTVIESATNKLQSELEKARQAPT